MCCMPLTQMQSCSLMSNCVEYQLNLRSLNSMNSQDGSVMEDEPATTLLRNAPPALDGIPTEPPVEGCDASRPSKHMAMSISELDIGPSAIDFAETSQGDVISSPNLDGIFFNKTKGKATVKAVPPEDAKMTSANPSHLRPIQPRLPLVAIVSSAAINQLLDMGFDWESIRVAMAASQNNVERAANYLLNDVSTIVLCFRPSSALRHDASSS